MTQLIQMTAAGFYCPAGDFYIDPWKPVDRAVVTHAHSDHARLGSQRYLAAETSREVLRIRLGDNADLKFQPLGDPLSIHGVKVTFFPAGHVLGSAQVCIEQRGERVVISGDYKRHLDPTCKAFEPVRCQTFATESTFGLPIYRWPEPDVVIEEINDWWRANQTVGKASLLLAYSLGKAQRVLASVDRSIGPIYTHGAVEKLNQGYRQSSVDLPQTTYVGAADKKTAWERALIVAPPSVAGSAWIRRFGKMSTAMASGWMQIRGTRRRRSIDRGFVLSDHVDWDGLLATIGETEAESVWVTHGYADIVARHLRDTGIDAKAVETEFDGELLDGERGDIELVVDAQLDDGGDDRSHD